MLERLADVYWEGLTVRRASREGDSYSCKNAQHVPTQLTKLLSSKPFESMQRLASDLPESEAASSAIPFLWELAASPAVRCRKEIFFLLGDLIDPTVDASEGAMWASREDRSLWMLKARHAAWCGFETALRLSQDLDAGVREGAAFILGAFAGLQGDCIPNEWATKDAHRTLANHLLTAIRHEEVPSILCSFAFATAQLPQRDAELAAALDSIVRSDASFVVRIAAATASIVHGVSTVGIQLLLAACYDIAGTNQELANLETEDGRVPWLRPQRHQHRGGFDWILKHVVSADADEITALNPGLLSIISAAEEEEWERYVQPVFLHAFPQQHIPPQLAAFQRQMLQTAFDNLSLWSTQDHREDFGMPERAELPAYGVVARIMTPEEARAALQKLVAGQNRFKDDSGRELILRDVVTEELLAALCTIPECVRLEVCGGPTILSELHLSRLAELPALKNLWYLHIPNANLTDAAVRVILQFRNLKELNLAGSALSDVGLVALAPLQLDALYVSNTNVTTNGIKEYLKLRPHCHVST